jgi:hypothetical protein
MDSLENLFAVEATLDNHAKAKENEYPHSEQGGSVKSRFLYTTFRNIQERYPVRLHCTGPGQRS